jgi:hypothetical protein
MQNKIGLKLPNSQCEKRELVSCINSYFSRITRDQVLKTIAIFDSMFILKIFIERALIMR